MSRDVEALTAALQFGDKAGGNTTDIETDGTMVAKGDATAWDDLTSSLIANRLSPVAGKVQYNYANNSVTMNSGGAIAVENDRLIFNYQIPHAAREDSEMRLHVHWEQIDSTAREFKVQYRIQNNNAAKTTSWTDVTINSNTNNVFSYSSGTLNQITNLIAVDLTGASISGTVQFRLARTDSVAGDIEFVFVDAHIEYNMLGSRSEFVK